MRQKKMKDLCDTVVSRKSLFVDGYRLGTWIILSVSIIWTFPAFLCVFLHVMQRHNYFLSNTIATRNCHCSIPSSSLYPGFTLELFGHLVYTDGTPRGELSGLMRDRQDPQRRIIRSYETDETPKEHCQVVWETEPKKLLQCVFASKDIGVYYLGMYIV
jgi:hypothetical protein